MQRKFRQAFTAVKEHGCVSYAKIATIGGFCDLDHVVVKATSPNDLPLPDRYVHELLKIFLVSPSSFRAFSLTFTRRFNKTQCWRVALKCLVLLHRLLRSLPENSPFRTELLWTRSNGLLCLYPCKFKDSSSSASEDYTGFIRSYAQLLDEALDCLSIDNNRADYYEDEDEDEDEDEEVDDEEKEVPQTLEGKMKEVGRLLELLPQLQSLIDRVIDCRPTGAASRSFLVQSAMKHIIRDSFVCYTSFRRDVMVVLDDLIQMPYRSGVAAFGIYKKASVQAIQLSEFYDWCKSMGLCGSYEYPFIDRIPQIQVQALENFLNGMWQLTESSSSTASPLTSALERSPLSSFTEGESENQEVVEDEDKLLAKKEEGGEEMEPLIQFDHEVTNNTNNDTSWDWEALLEASISPSTGLVPRNNFFFNSNGHDYGYGHRHSYGYEYEHEYEHGHGYGQVHGHNLGNEQCEQTNRWQTQIYNPYALNPFYQQHNISQHYGSFATNPTYPWGL
ncbi:putative clathrin assembly protein [Camellia lanceoleosa]|uniref:Clathrin assembly protein n=1 Tax=Camellia lanceoleosa TaxID=1840588 RepID=A0ACC0G468_9ERIC|nr:putative clathrin assembly protein [Camellia lanceoleosa]